MGKTDTSSTAKEREGKLVGGKKMGTEGASMIEKDLERP